MTNTNVRHRGVALVVVLVVVAMASLIGMAMLSSASLQAQISSSQSKRLAAEYLADSAVETAAYYLQNSASMPAGWGTQPGYVLYAQNKSVPGVNGSFDVQAVASGIDTYTVTATGRSTGTTPIARSATATIMVNRLKPNVAGGFGGAITIPQRYTFNGRVVASGSVLLENLTAIINGVVSTTLTPSDYAAPSAATINYYGTDVVGGTYTMPDGTVGTPQLISSPLISAPVANAGNPGKVFYVSGPLVISGNVAISGTIIARGTITFQGGPCNISVTPVSGFPAVIADNALTVFFKNVTVTLNGVVWAGGGTAWSGLLNTASTLNINGALLVPAGKTLGSSLTGAATINHVAANCNVPNLTKTLQPGTSVKYVSWSP